MIAARSPIVRLGVGAVTPLALVAAAYLFFAGHNRPGGGFAAGLVLGAVVALRRVAGLRCIRNVAALLAVGGLLAAATALAPLVVGNPLLDQVVLDKTLPVLGKVKAGSALLFDAGVTLVVVGLVSAVLDGLGAGELGVTPTDGEAGL
jgi:multisubunit Na+/H+ antiporter MnhB subunit